MAHDRDGLHQSAIVPSDRGPGDRLGHESCPGAAAQDAAAKTTAMPTRPLGRRGSTSLCWIKGP